MAILTEADIPIYAPSVTLTGDALIGAILNCQYQIESVKGANRPLEITQFTEQKQFNSRQQNAYLAYYPLVINDNYPIEVKVRIGNEVNRFGHGISPQEWQTLDSSEYILDRSLGRISLNLGDILYRFQWWGYAWQNPSAFFSEVQLAYYSGFDFTDTTDSNVRFIKSMAGQLLTYLQSASYQGVKKLVVPFREFEIEYNNSSTGEIPEQLLLPFKRFQPVIL